MLSKLSVLWGHVWVTQPHNVATVLNYMLWESKELHENPPSLDRYGTLTWVYILIRFCKRFCLSTGVFIIWRVVRRAVFRVR